MLPANCQSNHDILLELYKYLINKLIVYSVFISSQLIIIKLRQITLTSRSMNHAFCIPYKVKFIYFLDKLIFLYKSSTFHLKFEKKSRSVGFVFDF